MSADRQYDVVVIGGGAAGLSGAVALARSRRSALVVDAGLPRNASADGVHDYLGREGAPPLDLLARGRVEAEAYGATVLAGTVTAVEQRDGGGFRVALGDGTTASARRLLLATGPTAVHQALLFRQLSADVVFFRHTGPEPGPDDAQQLAAPGIPVVEDPVAAVEVTGDRLTGVRLGSGEVVPRSVLVVAPRFTARDDLVAPLGLTATDQVVAGIVVGAVPADPTGATGVPGVWVAGNVADVSAQVAVGAAAGMRAGAMINADLVAEDARRAVAQQRQEAAA